MKFFFSIYLAIVVCFLFAVLALLLQLPVKDTFVCSWCNAQCTRMEDCRIRFICSIEIKNLERFLSVGPAAQHILMCRFYFVGKDSIPTYFLGSYLLSL